MTPTEQLRFARQRYGKALRAIDAVRHRNMVGVGEPKIIRLGSSTIEVYPETFDANAAERARLCRRANRLVRVIKMIAARHGLSQAI